MCPQPTIAQSKKAINIYLCYAYDVYKDKALIDELDKHLSSLERQGQVMIWSVRKVSAGKELVHEIDTYLNSADIILLLVSVGFMSFEARRLERSTFRKASTFTDKWQTYNKLAKS